MSENDLKAFVLHVTGYEVTKVEKMNEQAYKEAAKNYHEEFYHAGE